MGTKTEVVLGGGILGGGLFAVILVIGMIVGWVMNLVALCNCDFEASYKAEVIRGVGVVIPVVGGIAGYLDIEDGNTEE